MFEKNDNEPCYWVSVQTGFLGDPPAVIGVSLLRFFWEHVIDLYCSVLSTLFQDREDTTSPMMTFNIAGHETFVEEQTFNSPFLNIVLEIVLSLQRLVDSEMVFGSGNLCATEWEAFVKALDKISPWLVAKGDNFHEIRIEVLSIFSQITNFLESCSSSSNGLHPIIDDDTRNYLHLFLLRKVAPLLQSSNAFARPVSHPAMIGDDASVLAFAVVKSWCVIQSLPVKEGDWVCRAKHLLAEAFATPEETQHHSRYVNGYLHHPMVRLESLKFLVDDDSTEIEYSTNRDSDSVSTSGISNITPVSMKSGNVLPRFSLFSLTKNMRELHIILVNDVILPRLSELLSNTKSPVVETSECQQNLNSERVSSTTAFFLDAIEKEFMLRRFAVKMLGMLFRSRTGEGDKRQYYIELLQKVATSTPYGIR